jgi:hypothetical protein
MAPPAKEIRPVVIKEADYLSDPVYTTIAKRFLRFTPKILINEHIDAMKEVGRTHSEGITFLVKDDRRFRAALINAKISGEHAFHWDDRKVWVYALAALATDGEGYREIGQPSLHCAISKTICNVHIDEFGFVEIGPDGEEYITPESARHIVDELVWRAKVRPFIFKALDTALPRSLSVPAGELLDRTYIVAPSQENKYDLRVGAGVKFKLRDTIDLRFEYTCGNINCSDNLKALKFSIDL